MKKYYRINDMNLIGKLDDFIPYLHINGKWEVDNNNVLMDRLMGYDVSEPKDSNYKMGSTDMLLRIDEIAEEEALKLVS